jgi:acyl transferase domain-containing protein
VSERQARRVRSRLCGVSAFAFQGTNAHALLQPAVHSSVTSPPLHGMRTASLHAHWPTPLPHPLLGGCPRAARPPHPRGRKVTAARTRRTLWQVSPPGPQQLQARLHPCGTVSFMVTVSLAGNSFLNMESMNLLSQMGFWKPS